MASDISHEVFRDDTTIVTENQPEEDEVDEDDYKYDKDKDLLEGDPAILRAKLDHDHLGNSLLSRYLVRDPYFFAGKSSTILATMMIRVGAYISKENLHLLRKLVPEDPCSEGYFRPPWDDDFFGPGVTQFLHLLHVYKPGVTRDISAPWYVP